MLSEALVHGILNQLKRKSIAVVGDFFLDKYLDIDGRLTEPSVETGLDAYQVVSVRVSPGAAGTVTNNLAALGVGCITAVTLIGDDGEGFELSRELQRRGVSLEHVIQTPDRFTPTYTKPMLADGSNPARELNRLDIKNRQPVSDTLVQELLRRLEKAVVASDAVIVADQVSEVNCGVITDQVRAALADLARRHPSTVILADSRERIGQFHHVLAKPNRRECLEAVGNRAGEVDDGALEKVVRELVNRTGRPVYCTLGEQGILYVDEQAARRVPGYPVDGPVDPVGAGDSTSAGIVAALCSGAEPIDAAAFGNLIASITVQQIGTTGVATPQQVLDRFRASRLSALDALD